MKNNSRMIVNDEWVRNTVSNMIREIVARDGRPDYVAGITRGGLVPANLFSQYFGVPLLTVNWSLRDNPCEDIDAIDLMSTLMGEGNRVLLVDDICDDGATLNAIWEHLYVRSESNTDHRLRSAVLIHNTAGTLFYPDYVGKEINKRSDIGWVEFPWENWWAK